MVLPKRVATGRPPESAFSSAEHDSVIGLMCCVFQRCSDVIVFKVRVIFQDFPPCCAGGKHFQDVADTNSQSTNAGTSATDSRLDCDAIQ